MIIFIHELGHIIIAKMFKRKLSRIDIYPFGGKITFDSFISSDIFEDLMISVSGILFQIILGITIYILYKNDIISIGLYQTITMYNTLIITFNLIPMCPLDGYKIFKLICELFIPYKKVFTIGLIVSFLSITFISLYNLELIRDNLFVFIFIVVLIKDEYMTRFYILTRFYLERMNYDFNFKIISRISKIDDMYKNRLHIIGVMNEKEYLKKLYLCK